ncbi:MAG: flagellar basal body P-ring formation protein FlgA [Phycisphaerae bacterium]|nr:flagellar basal body P-ring formation protein FlgA [Phycisphaerae bacterium]
MKSRRMVLFYLAGIFVSVCPEAAGTSEERLKIFLPRDITVSSTAPTLGQAAVLQGSEMLAAKAGSVALGYMAEPGQTLVISRNVVLSRLACSGIPLSSVTLLGAEEVRIHCLARIVSGSQIAQEAADFLKENPPDKSACQFDILRSPADLVLADVSGDIEFVCRLLENGSKSQCRVEVAAVRQGRTIGRREVVFRCRYPCRRVVTTRAIAKGELISPENTAIENGFSDSPEQSDWSVPYGQAAVRSIPARTVLTAQMTGAAKPPIAVKRNQSVAIRIDNPGFTATASGKALQDGAAGALIKVQNVNSKIIILAKVNEDGTVEPVF